ncbi:MAG: hypothetical protein E6J13_09030 [Chloroflexi bacterium]|nr:MAG: hypothetical protein E6J13_09030 [Chloroflexota bacterium]
MSVEPSAIEIRRLTGVARRELADAAIPGLSPDGSFEHAYVAALTAATILIRAHGERIHGPEHHRLTFVRLGELANGRWAGSANYFQHCRVRRNRSMYDQAGGVSAAEAGELRVQAEQLLAEVRAWLRAERPGLSS